ncbi:MAG: aminopeptidase [Nanoarchaeota archaeon]|nr:aminopeptidase [Nanoarchaeota archaeon]
MARSIGSIRKASSLSKMLEKAALNVLKSCMGLKKKESFLVVYDKNKQRIANILLEKARKISKKVDEIETPIGKVNGEEPSKKVAYEIKKYDVVVMATTKSLSHTDARRNASKKGVRIASMPGITEDMMKRTLTADYNKIKRLSQNVSRVLKNKKKIRLITKKGTDLVVHTNKLFTDIGFYTGKGDFGNLPAGEVGFAPVEGKTNGVLIVDKTMAGIGKLKSSINIEVKDGFVTKISGKGDANKLRIMLKNQKNKNVYNIAEFAIGTNYKAKITGLTLEDEKVYGTVHVAVGDNTSYPGGKTKAPLHLDGIISKPTVIVDEKKIMKDGKLLL